MMVLCTTVSMSECSAVYMHAMHVLPEESLVYGIHNESALEYDTLGKITDELEIYPTIYASELKLMRQ